MLIRENFSHFTILGSSRKVMGRVILNLWLVMTCGFDILCRVDSLTCHSSIMEIRELESIENPAGYNSKNTCSMKANKGFCVASRVWEEEKFFCDDSGEHCAESYNWTSGSGQCIQKVMEGASESICCCQEDLCNDFSLLEKAGHGLLDESSVVLKMGGSSDTEMPIILDKSRASFDGTPFLILVLSPMIVVILYLH